MIEAHNLSKAYRPDVYALADVSFTVEKGEFVFLTGPSGAGKTTLCGSCCALMCRRPATPSWRDAISRV
jgi:ABC-type multidrug transport system ATPase subunit